jgi:hypothetical protein
MKHCLNTVNPWHNAYIKLNRIFKYQRAVIDFCETILTKQKIESPPKRRVLVAPHIPFTRPGRVNR